MSPFSPGRPLGRSLRRASARAAIGRGAALPTDARNYAYALHAPISGSGVVCLGVVPARSTWRREAALSQLHRVTGTCRLSLALPPATPNVTRWPLLIECLARTATWDAPADFEPEMMGRRSLPPRHNTITFALRLLDVRVSLRRGDVPHRIVSNGSLRRMLASRLECPLPPEHPDICCAARRDIAKRCATNKQDQRLSRHGARPRSPVPAAHIPTEWEPLGELRGSTSTCGLSSSESGRALLGPTSGRRINAYGEAPFHRAASARPLR